MGGPKKKLKAAATQVAKALKHKASDLSDKLHIPCCNKKSKGTADDTASATETDAGMTQDPIEVRSSLKIEIEEDEPIAVGKASKTPEDILDYEDSGFWTHTKKMFNQHSPAMDTENHSLALYLHLLCRQLTPSQVANGHSFEYMETAALTIAKQWHWPKAKVKLLQEDLKKYHKGGGGGVAVPPTSR
ncbi:hypothetical protein K466DRAFT_606037 [Polyporus arcularius HHB13444]|uniref:Uncharacterized protein n=1 Tax=Polyporus arcularius HHB13444 TaxID=1314778 RepID=A0A5C3NUB9_9APHY|nr:hypothetical protein K466DRAFT_606037 [Polyporus arcularius HHB13444]